MLLSHKTTIQINETYANLIGHMCYAAYKLWNVCNYERRNYKQLSMPVNYPDWYYQKQAHKDDIWFKQLPSQTAQEVCKLLDKAWKSFYVLKKTGGIENPKPPRFKHENIAITYMQNAVRHEVGSDTIRLSLPKKLREYMAAKYNIHETYLYFKNKIFKDVDVIKQVKIYPPAGGICEVIVVYEVPDVQMLPENGKFLSIDLGLHNLMTGYASSDGNTFIIGRKYLSLCHYYNKEIARVQSQWAKQQSRKGIQYPKSSKHIKKLYRDKANAIQNYLHKVTRYVVDYCKRKDIRTVVIGDLTNIRKDKDLGHVTNQKLHSLPYKKIYTMLEYKLAMEGIRLVKQKESYSSQCSPMSAAVGKKYTCKTNRIKRGLYQDKDYSWNADCVGAFNILRLHFQASGNMRKLDPHRIQVPHVVKVAV